VSGAVPGDRDDVRRPLDEHHDVRVAVALGNGPGPAGRRALRSCAAPGHLTVYGTVGTA
jgi:hypothetical protein